MHTPRIHPPATASHHRHAPAPARHRLRGLSMVELLIFIVIVSGALVGVLTALLPGSQASADPMLRRQALALAEALLEEVQLMPFTWCDADDANVETATSAAGCATSPEAAGPEAGEGRFAPPSYDHVNDYNGITLASIVDLTNTAIPALAGYSASVGVAAADLGSLTAASGNALRITVTVNGPHGTSVTLDGWRTRHAPNAAF